MVVVFGLPGFVGALLLLLFSLQVSFQAKYQDAID